MTVPAVSSRITDVTVFSVGAHITRVAELEASEDDPQPGPERLRASSLVSLHALGADAWNLLPLLPLLQMDPELAFAGRTGSLRLSGQGKLARGPAWAIFSGGRPVPMQWPTATE